jgi:hypothetical protein
MNVADLITGTATQSARQSLANGLGQSIKFRR